MGAVLLLPSAQTDEKSLSLGSQRSQARLGGMVQQWDAWVMVVVEACAGVVGWTRRGPSPVSTMGLAAGLCGRRRRTLVVKWMLGCPARHNGGDQSSRGRRHSAVDAAGQRIMDSSCYFVQSARRRQQAGRS